MHFHNNTVSRRDLFDAACQFYLFICHHQNLISNNTKYFDLLCFWPPQTQVFWRKKKNLCCVWSLYFSHFFFTHTAGPKNRVQGYSPVHSTTHALSPLTAAPTICAGAAVGRPDFSPTCLSSVIKISHFPQRARVSVHADGPACKHCMGPCVESRHPLHSLEWRWLPCDHRR